MASTSRRSFPYPATSSAVNVPGDVQALAEAVDAAFDSALITTKAASAILTEADIGKIVEMDVATANTLTIPSGLPAGKALLVVQIGAGQTTLVQGAGVTIVRRYGLVMTGQGAGVLLYSRSTTQWVAIGGITA
jgi:hypothetical protein